MSLGLDEYLKDTSFDIGVDPSIAEVKYDLSDPETFHDIYRGTHKPFQYGLGFAAPITDIGSGFEMGQPFTIVCEEDKKAADWLNVFFRKNHEKLVNSARLRSIYGEVFTLEDYLGGIHTFSPRFVDVDNELLNPDKVRRIQIKEKRKALNKAEDQKVDVIVERVISKDKFSITVTDSEGRNVLRKAQFPNIWGVVPVQQVKTNHLPENARGVSDHFSLIPWYNMYHHILTKAVENQLYHGKAIPYITGIRQNIRQYVRSVFGKSSPSGQEVASLFKKHRMIFAGEGTNVGLLESSHPLGEAKELLVLIFYIIVQRCEIPEFLFGVSIDSANATIREQWSPILARTNRKRQEWAPYIRDMCKTALLVNSNRPARFPEMDENESYGAIEIDLSSYTADVVANLHFDVKFPDLLTQQGELTLEIVQWLWENDLMIAETVLSLYPEIILDIGKNLDGIEPTFRYSDLKGKNMVEMQPNDNGNGNDPKNKRKEAKRVRKQENTGRPEQVPSRGTR